MPQAVRATPHVVGPDYFPTMGLSPTAGSNADRSRPGTAGAMAVINQNLADALWPGQNPLGKTMTFRALTFRGPSDVETERVEVVGVMPNAFVFGFNPERPDPRPEPDLHRRSSSAFADGRSRSCGPGEITFYLRHGSSDSGIRRLGAWTGAPRNRASHRDRVHPHDGRSTRRRDV